MRLEMSVGLGKLLEVGMQQMPGKDAVADYREETTTRPELPPQGAIARIARNPRSISLTTVHSI